jgi:hypothetical protein
VIVAEPDGTQVATVVPGAEPIWCRSYAFDVGAPVCSGGGRGLAVHLAVHQRQSLPALDQARMLQPAWLELAVAADSVALDGRSGDGLLDGHGLIALAGGDRGAARGGRGAALRAQPTGRRCRWWSARYAHGGGLAAADRQSFAGRRGDDLSRGRAGASRRAGTGWSIAPRVVTTGMCRTGTAARRCVRARCRRARRRLSPTDAGVGESRGRVVDGRGRRARAALVLHELRVEWRWTGAAVRPAGRGRWRCCCSGCGGDDGGDGARGGDVARTADGGLWVTRSRGRRHAPA